MAGSRTATVPKYLKAKKPVTVPVDEGRQHQGLQVGEPIATEKLAGYFVERIGSDPWLENLLEEASEEDVANWEKGLFPEPDKDFDRARIAQMEGVALPPPDHVATLVDGDEFMAQPGEKNVIAQPAMREE